MPQPKAPSSPEESNLTAGQNSLLDFMRENDMQILAETYAYVSFGRDIEDLSAEELESREGTPRRARVPPID